MNTRLCGMRSQTDLTSVAHFPALEVEHCEVIGRDGQIQLHRQNGLTVHFPRTEEVHSENCAQETEIRLNANKKNTQMDGEKIFSA